MDPSRETSDRPGYGRPPVDPGPATQAYRPPGVEEQTAYRPAPPAEPTREIAGRPAPPPKQSGAPARAEPTAGAAPDARAPVQIRRLRRGRLAIRKIDPWAVLRFSLVFYFCMLLILLLSTAIIFAVLKVFGVVDNLEQLLRDLDFEVTIAGGTIFRWMFLLGLVGTVIASAITVFMAFLYNLIADVVGGIELLVTEREARD